MRSRLNKKDRIKQAGKGNKIAQYVWRAKKRPGKVFGHDGRTSAQRQAELLKDRRLDDF